MLGLPRKNGKLKELDKFDATVFGVNPKQAENMDPQLRILLEVTYEAIIDAGEDPIALRGTRTGVFVGASNAEFQEYSARNGDTMTGHSVTGGTKAMFANRLSFHYDLKGPSYVVDTSCSSSLLALDHAFHSMRHNQCEEAIVAGTNLCLNPCYSLGYQKLQLLSPDGVCKTFDANANGYCRSEGIVVVYLRKRADAKRLYSKIVNSKSNSDGFADEGLIFPSGTAQATLIREVYSEVGVEPSSVSYVEAHGTGTKIGDAQEANAITEVFCEGRTSPLLVGSVKSNMGHSEPNAGLAGIAKVLIAMETGIIPANLHYKSPNPNIPGLTDGRLQVVSENTEWGGGFVGINSFGIGGTNVHTVLKSYDVTSNHSEAEEKRLFLYSSRTYEGLQNVLGFAKQHPKDTGWHYLMDETSRTSPSTYKYRGYTVMNSQDGVTEIQECDGRYRPMWYIFSGMGSQWHGMGRSMMNLGLFRESILKLDAELKPYDFHLYDTLMSEDPSTFENVTKSFVGIVSIQIALVDVLRSMEIQPTGIVGHSLGELACGYADGSLTAREAILAAYWRGKCIEESEFPPGGMAAVGMTWEQVVEQCPTGIEPACHNSEDMVTVSGPAAAVKKFVEDLNSKQIFAKEVRSCGVAFHSSYMKKVAPTLQDRLGKVIVPKERSSRWISSSVPVEKWGGDLAKYSSAEYYINNVLSPVLFYEALQHIPDNAVVVEIAPHCLLQSIIRRSISGSCFITSLMKRDHTDNLEYFLTNIGKCYNYGLNLRPLKLHNPLALPVSRGTTMTGPFVNWDHSTDWKVTKAKDFVSSNMSESAGATFDIDISSDSPDSYIADHQIDGRILYPATGFLVVVWKTFAKLKGAIIEEMAVTFEDIKIHRPTPMSVEDKITFEVNILANSGDFEISTKGSIVVTGRIRETDEQKTSEETTTHDKATENELTSHDKEKPTIDPLLHDKTTEYELTSTEVYKLLRLKGYDYGTHFRGIKAADTLRQEGRIVWNGNWVTYLDSVLQMFITFTEEGLVVPIGFRSIKIDPLACAKDIDHRVNVNNTTRSAVTHAVEILGCRTAEIPLQQHQPPLLEEVHFIPYTDNQFSEKFSAFQEYAEICNAFSEKFLQTSCGIAVGKDRNSNKHENICDSGLACLQNKKDHGILGSLIDATSENKRFLKEKIWSNDPLLETLTSMSVLKPCLDVVLENTVSRPLKIVELGADSGRMFSHIYPSCFTDPLVKVEYTACGSEDKLIQLLEEEKKREVQIVTWDANSELPDELQYCNLVIAKGVLMQKDIRKFLSNVSIALVENSFLLIHETTSNHAISFAVDILSGKQIDSTSIRMLDEHQLEAAFAETGFEIVFKRTDGVLASLYLLKKKRKFHGECRIVNIDGFDFSWIDQLKQLLQDCSKESTIDTLWLTVHETCNSGIVGLVNCLRYEAGGEKIRCIFNTDRTPFRFEAKDIRTIRRKDLVMNVYSDGKWGSFRHLPFCQDDTVMRSCDTAHVNILKPGNLSSLTWVESSLGEVTTDATICNVHFAALNFRDLMLASGKLRPDVFPDNQAFKDCLLGMEFSGYDTKTGNRVMGIVPVKGLATAVNVQTDYIWNVPDHWTLEDAATVPVAYITAYYALVVRGVIKKGEKVLIHSGSGSVGQAAINIARHYGCEVFTTVGSHEKRIFLKERFPWLHDDHISNSRDLSFESDILSNTNDKGVDVVLNSLSEEKLKASLRILAQHGRFLEIGKFDMSQNNRLEMSTFLKNISFHGIVLNFGENNPQWPGVAVLFEEGLSSGAIKPLRTTVFEKNQLEEAFRYMSKGIHIGKVIFKTCSLIEIRPYVLMMLIVSNRDVSVMKDAMNLIEESGEVGGIFHLAMVLKDGFLENQTKENFIAVSQPKVSGTINLDIATREICKKKLDWFVVFSSIRSGRGNAGQSNYGFANSVMERVCENRKRDGYAALAIQWGAVGDVGAVADFFKTKDDSLDGLKAQKIHSCLSVLEKFLIQSHPVVFSFVPMTTEKIENKATLRLTADDLADKIFNIFGVKDRTTFNRDTSFVQLGLDSMLSVEIAQMLDRDFNIYLQINEIRQISLNNLKKLCSGSDDLKKSKPAT